MQISWCDSLVGLTCRLMPVSFPSVAYQPTHGQVVRQRNVVTRNDSSLMDDESRRLIEDANLLISRDSLILCDIIGQGQSLQTCVVNWFLGHAASRPGNALELYSQTNQHCVPSFQVILDAFTVASWGLEMKRKKLKLPSKLWRVFQVLISDYFWLQLFCSRHSQDRGMRSLPRFSLFRISKPRRRCQRVISSVFCRPFLTERFFMVWEPKCRRKSKLSCAWGFEENLTNALLLKVYPQSTTHFVNCSNTCLSLLAFHFYFEPHFFVQFWRTYNP